MQRGIIATFILMAAEAAAARLGAASQQAFETYVAGVETRISQQHASAGTYLAAPMSGELRIEPLNGGTWPVSGALLHHWRASSFVAGATPKQMLALLRDFDHMSNHYAPEIVSARALADDGEHATLAVRLKEQKVLTIVLDAEYRVETRLSGDDRGYSISRSTHIREVDHPGTARERRRAEGNDDGFLWRLNSYWSFARVPGGLRMECEAVSMTRDIPPGLAWLIEPIIADYPREALEFTMRATKQALIQETNR